MEPEQAIAILKLLHVEDATKEFSEQPSDLDAQSLVAGEELKRARRPRMDFVEIGIPIGSTLISSDDGVTAVVVVDSRKVRLGDEELSLSAATQRILGLDYQVQPSPHWTYQGRSLHEIYNETHTIAV
jgi:hypothetical protein